MIHTIIVLTLYGLIIMAALFFAQVVITLFIGILALIGAGIVGLYS